MPFNRVHLIRKVDLFSLKLFLSVVEEGQIGRAATCENISASTATKRIQDLEEVADIKLFDRNPSGVVPTSAGRVLERHLRTIFSEIDDLRAEIGTFFDGIRGELSIASAGTIISPFLAQQLGDFSREYPLVDLVLREMDNVRILQSVVNREAEIGVYAAAAGLNTHGVDIVPYREDRMVALLPRDHPLATRDSVRFEELLSEHLIPIEAMMGAFEAAAAKLRREFTPRFVVRTAEAATSLIRAGLGVTVLPECLVSSDVMGEVGVVRLDETWARRQILIATAQGKTPGKATVAFIEQLLERSERGAPETKIFNPCNRFRRRRDLGPTFI